MSKKVYKYGTGDLIPDGADYMSTLVEETSDSPYRLVWHYFLVETGK